MKLLGSDHPITITPNPRRLRVTFSGKVVAKVVAEASRALTLQKVSYPPVQYVPRKDADAALLKGDRA